MLSYELLNALPIMAGNSGAGRELTRILTAIDSKDTIRFFDDFLGDVVSEKWSAADGSDPQSVLATILAGQVNGVVRLTSGDAGTGDAADASVLTLGLNWSAAMGNLFMEAKVKLSAITAVRVNVGFTDVLATTTLESPFSLGASDALTSVTTNGVCFVFDTAADTDVWWACGVKADVDATKVNTGSVPVADTYQTLRIEIDLAGTATFYIDGRIVATVANAVTAATPLTPVISVVTTTTATKSVDADYLEVSGDRL
jgi:hypothetical protein